ncbi:zinc finger protein 26-like isoform X3 [Culex pipiens pallens]|uniref:zinc finger protein 26-like isoform X3 n=1 Tax=Culex pipiens pallens TaxID=42434 RepID=UPI001953EEEB|nr:zinc finger protein 26-like isoform X3 [Culex pipiens pallens]
MSRCIVPHCRNLLQEWIAPFPADQLLQTRWKHCIEMGTSELLPEVDVLGPAAVVCNMHFLGFDPDEDKVSTRYRQPTLFFRDDLVLEIESCCLCAQVRIKEEMLDKDSPLTQECTIEEVVKELFGESYFDEEKGGEYVCEMCTAKVDVLLTVHKHFEAGQLMLKTLRYKQTLEGVRFEKNGGHAIELPSELAAMLGPLEEDSAGGKPVKGSKRKKKAQVDVEDLDVTLNPLETVIKVEEATLQLAPEQLQSMSSSESVAKEKSKGKPTVMMPLESTDPSTGQVMVEYIEKTRAELAEEVKRYCYLCDTLFSTPNILLAHLVMTHKNPATLRCKVCKLQFEKSVTCNSHLRFHDTLRRPVQCEYCPLRFTNTGMRWFHNTKVHPDKVLLTRPPTTESITRQTIVKIVPITQNVVEPQLQTVPAQQVKLKAVPPLAPIVVEPTVLVSQPKITPNIPSVSDYSCKTCFKSFQSLDILKTHMKSHRSARPPALKDSSPDETTDDNMISIPTFHPVPKAQPVVKLPLQAPTVTSDLSEGKINGVGIVKLLGQLDLPPLIPFATKHHSEQHPHSCKTCFKAFETLASVKTHLQTHRKSPPTSEPPKRKRIFRTRKSKPHPSGTFTCSICSQELPTPTSLVKHFTSAHPQLTLDHFRCRYCADIFFSREALSDHAATHRGKYECGRCALEFINHRRFGKHRQVAHKAPSKALLRDCQYCGKSFRRGMALARHVKTHFAGQWTCDICEEQFGERYKLVLHMRQHSGNNPLVCYNCNEHFGDPDMLDRHERECAQYTFGDSSEYSSGQQKNNQNSKNIFQKNANASSSTQCDIQSGMTDRQCSVLP